MQTAPDSKAIAIVKHAFWDKGWRNSPLLSSDERAYLETSGYMLPARLLSHDQCLTWAHSALARVTKEQVARAFVWSLGSRQLEYRSALGSFAHLHLMPPHEFIRTPTLYNDYCAVCGCRPMAVQSQNFLIENFERHMWGGVRHDDLSYMAFDLDCFHRLAPQSPTQREWELLLTILTAAADPVDGKTYTSLKRKICQIVESKDAEAAALCSILGFAGILKPDDCPAFDGNYVPFGQRGDGHSRSDLKYPLSWWRGPGFCASGVAYWFPELADAASRYTRLARQAAPIVPAARSGARLSKTNEERSNRPRQRPTKIPSFPFLPRSNALLLPGHFFSFQLPNGCFACGRVLETTWPVKPSSRTMFKVGLMNWSGDRPATADDLAGCKVLEEGWAHVTILQVYNATIDGFRALELDQVIPDSAQEDVYGHEVLRIYAQERFGGEQFSC